MKKQTVSPSNDSERSPSVHYANWKETIFLDKKLATIKKTEQGVVHRITVDQKVMFRRFQHMLTRTKVAQARVTNDKQTIQQLLGESKQRLHCESHLHNHEDASFLKKLKKDPCEFESAEAKRRFIESRRKSKSIQTATDQGMISLIQTVMQNGDIKHTPINIAQLSALGNILDSALGDKENELLSVSGCKVPHKEDISDHQVQQKAVCTLSNFSDKTGNDMKISNEKPPISKSANNKVRNDNNDENLLQPRVNAIKSLSDINKIIVQTDCIGEREPQSSADTSAENSVTFTEITRRPAPLKSKSEIIDSIATKCEGKLASTPTTTQTLNNKLGQTEAQPTSGSVMISTSRQQQQTKAPAEKKMSSLFEEVKLPDIHGMRLQEALRVDYTAQVKDFIHSLSNFGQGVPDFDYYASKMQMDAAMQMNHDLPPQMPATPEHVYRKHTGDTTIKCITLPELKIRKGDNNRYDDTYVFSLDDLIPYGASESNSSYGSDEDVDLE